MSASDRSLPENLLSERTPFHTLVLKLNDRPGGMELVAATFAHRGISLSLSLGHDGALDPDGYATVLVHFRATRARKAAIKAALSRLSRVVSLREYDAQDRQVRQCALVRLASSAPAPALPPDSESYVHVVMIDPDTGETLYSLVGPTGAINNALQAARDAGHLSAVTYAVLAL